MKLGLQKMIFSIFSIWCDMLIRGRLWHLIRHTKICHLTPSAWLKQRNLGNGLQPSTKSQYQKSKEEPTQQSASMHHWKKLNGVILYKSLVVIPPSQRNTVLQALHAAHQGISIMTVRAETSIFWPGITKCIIKLREQCQNCNRIAPSQPSAPSTPTNSTWLPFSIHICRLLPPSRK